MASKESSTRDLLKTQLDELQKTKMDLEQLKNELTMAQAKYDQRLVEYEAKFQELHTQAEKVQQEQLEKEINLENANAEWRDVKSRLESSAMPSNTKVKLNVGGRFFQTTVETLTKSSDTRLTYFKTLFSGQWQSEKDPKDDSIFIDRDGDLFEYILQYLRTGKIPIDINHDLLRQDLITEAHFYKLDSLVNLLNRNLSKDKSILKSQLSVQSKNLFIETKILSLNDQMELNKLGECENQQWQLIYRASRDGYTAQAFHQFCDGCFPTMCVIRSTNDCIFGGFTSIPWSSTSADKSDALAFLFTLKNPLGVKPTKYPIQQRAVNFAISYDQKNGPIFGSSQYGGIDLLLHSPFNLSSNRIGFPHSYQDMTKIGRSIFTGGGTFACEDLEIFTLI